MQIQRDYDLAVIGGSFAGLIASATAAARIARAFFFRARGPRPPEAEEAESTDQLAAPCLFP